MALSQTCDRDGLYPSLGMGSAVFFDKETFGEDRLVAAKPAKGATAEAWRDFMVHTPLSAAAQADVVRINTGSTDYLPGLTSAEKKDRLSRMSFRDYLVKLIQAGEKTST